MKITERKPHPTHPTLHDACDEVERERDALQVALRESLIREQSASADYHALRSAVEWLARNDYSVALVGARWTVHGDYDDYKGSGPSFREAVEAARGKERQ